MNRRDFLASPAVAAGIAQAAGNTEPALRLKADGTFKILMISDQHYTAEPDRYGLALTEKLIGIEKPDLVIAAGDCISGKDCATPADLKRAIANVGSAMEKMKVAWAIAFGNHDQEHFPKTNIGKEQVLQMYASYPHNLNAGWVRGISGAGNKSLLISDAAGAKPLFCVWLIDSGDTPMNGKEDRYDWIRTDQVSWYYQTSKDLEARHGRKIPGLMFFHIPLREFGEMALSKSTIGERHEPECPSNIHSGLFPAVLERGDVRGIFCGHDHVNNYLGLWRGVQLGYDGIVGYRGYPKVPPEDRTNERARGGRVFQISEPDPARYRTWMRFADGTSNWESWSDSYVRDRLK